MKKKRDNWRELAKACMKSGMTVSQPRAKQAKGSRLGQEYWKIQHR